MNWTNIISVIAIDVLFTSIILAFIFYGAEQYNSPFPGIASIAGAVFGLFFSVISGIVIMGFQLSIPAAILFALIFNGLLCWRFFIYNESGYKPYIIDFIALVIIGIINAIVFSLFNDGKFFQ